MFTGSSLWVNIMSCLALHADCAIKRTTRIVILIFKISETIILQDSIKLIHGDYFIRI